MPSPRLRRIVLTNKLITDDYATLSRVYALCCEAERDGGEEFSLALRDLAIVAPVMDRAREGVTGLLAQGGDPQRPDVLVALAAQSRASSLWRDAELRLQRACREGKRPGSVAHQWRQLLSTSAALRKARARRKAG